MTKVLLGVYSIGVGLIQNGVRLERWLEGFIQQSRPDLSVYTSIAYG